MTGAAANTTPPRDRNIERGQSAARQLRRADQALIDALQPKRHSAHRLCVVLREALRDIRSALLILDGPCWSMQAPNPTDAPAYEARPL